MPNYNSIRANNATDVYAAVIANFRRAYKEKYSIEPNNITDQEILLCWEVGWNESDGAQEDIVVLEEMYEIGYNKFS